MSKRVLVTLYRDEVAPRFDLATEILLADLPDEGQPAASVGHQTLLLGHPSPDDLCDLILARDVSVVITGGIEEEYYHYLRWKRVEVLDAVMGPAERALELFTAGGLKAGAILFDRNLSSGECGA